HHAPSRSQIDLAVTKSLPVGADRTVDVLRRAGEGRVVDQRHLQAMKPRPGWRERAVECVGSIERHVVGADEKQRDLRTQTRNDALQRSEERRVGKECRSRVWSDDLIEALEMPIVLLSVAKSSD